MEEQSNEALWYVVHTYSGYENKVATDLQTMVENRRLQDLICDIKVPTEMVPEIKDGKERICLLYTSPSPRDQRGSRMPSSA